jgi:phosphomethylpyrimidine synthase
MMARIFPSRRSVGEGGCSMRITEDVRKFAAEQKLSEKEALRAGMEQKAREFTEADAEIYSKA